MSILIKGMEMPKWNNNFERVERILISSSGLVEWVDDNNTLLAEYEAVELPPHGDLIDRDTILYGSNRLIQNYYGDTLGRRNYATDDEIRQAPAIIEAEEN